MDVARRLSAREPEHLSHIALPHAAGNQSHGQGIAHFPLVLFEKRNKRLTTPIGGVAVLLEFLDVLDLGEEVVGPLADKEQRLCGGHGSPSVAPAGRGGQQNETNQYKEMAANENPSNSPPARVLSISVYGRETSSLAT